MQAFKIGSCMQGVLPARAEYFKEELFCDVLVVPLCKPNMERVLDVMVWPEVVNVKLVDTPKGKSYEGQVLTGVKLVVQIKLKEKVTYVAHELSQSTHAVYYETLKSVFVVLPEKSVDGKSICEFFRSDRLTVTVYTEKVCGRMLDSRSIHRCEMLLVDVKIC